LHGCEGVPLNANPEHPSHEQKRSESELREHTDRSRVNLQLQVSAPGRVVLTIYIIDFFQTESDSLLRAEIP
jgi:hypothetical protein